MQGKQKANPIYIPPSADLGTGINPVETRNADTRSHLSSDCIFLFAVRPKGPDRARIHFECCSDMEGEKNKNNMLAEAKQNIFNSRPWRKIHELLSMATLRFCHICCLHSLLLPFFFSLSYPSVPAVPAQVLPTLLSTRPGICRQSLCCQVAARHRCSPLAAVLATPGLCAGDSDFFYSKR